MWDLGNRGIIVLVSVISGCVILCNVWGPFLALTITLSLVVCAWWTFHIADETPFTPHALLALDYLEQAGREINEFLEYYYVNLRAYIVDFGSTVKHLYRIHVVERMAHRRRSTYQLSTESFPSSRNSTRFSLVEGLSPIPNANFRPIGHSSNLENNPYLSNNLGVSDHSSLHKVTSTPLIPWRKGDSRNGEAFGAEVRPNRSPWKKSPLVPQNHTLSRGEDTTYSPEGSPWGTSISPKMRSRAGGVKTVQTVAGPLLASTRYNIDPKVYSDITSPGLTTRLTRYATEANNKLTHQSQYGTGQFPRVNLNSSPTPLINAKTGKMRMPVTVRVAPPENTRYSPPERQKILSDICHAEIKSPPSVVQVLREISLKRHASRDDVSIELAKKQRTESVFGDGLENLEEMTQKRGRDESSRSEEEISPQNKSLRPAKRTKMPSCYDIISSLSSSINVSSGVKRKAIDVSRSGTPDVGKHFKSLNTNHGDGGSTFVGPSRSAVEVTKSNKRALNELDTSRNSDTYSPSKKLVGSISQPSILKSSPGKDIIQMSCSDGGDTYHDVEEEDVTIMREIVPTKKPETIKLTDKLFMKAEPQNIDKLKILIEEHESIQPRFTTNDADEIKKSDIVNMRQTSMKTRLKSMFDAISGKAPSKINPEVVIQAEQVKASTTALIPASLNSSTSTIHINASPITTSAIVPIIGKSKPSATSAKHVTFQFTNADSSIKTSTTESINNPTTEPRVTSTVSEAQETKEITETPAVVNKPPTANTNFQNLSKPSVTTSAPLPASTFVFSSPSLNAILTATTTSASTGTLNLSSSSNQTSTTLTTSTFSPPQFSSTQLFNATSNAATLFGNSKSNSSALPAFSSTTQAAKATSQAPISLSFGTPATSGITPASSTSGVPTQVTLSTASQNFATPAGISVATTTSNIFGAGNNTTSAPPTFSSTVSNSFTSTATPASTSIFSFSSDTASHTTAKKGFTFGDTATSTATTVGSTTTIQPVTNSIAGTVTTTGGFNFSSNSAPVTSSSNNVFGTPTTTSSAQTSGFAPAATTTSSFSFGSNANTAAISKPSFSFGSSTTAAPGTTSTSTVPSMSFGVKTNTSLFGAPSTTASSAAVTTQPSIFGTSVASTGGFANTTSSSFNTTNSQPSFSVALNTSSNTFGTPKTTESSVFGTNANAPSPSFATPSTSSNVFSNVNADANTNVTPTTSVPTFGGTTFGQPAPTFASTSGTSLFGSQPTTTSAFGTPNSAPSTTTSIFGTSNAPTQTFGTTNTAPPAFGATNTSTPTFGAPSTTAPAPTFGAASISTSTATFGAPSTSAPAVTFGASNTTTPATGFGVPNTSTQLPAFGQQNSAAGTSGNTNPASSAFSTTTSAFGAVTTAPPAFGTSAPAFGTSASSSFGTPSNPPPAFSATKSSSFTRFGAPTPNADSPFGTPQTAGSSGFSTPNTATPTFGTTNNPSNNFTFGASQPTGQQQQQSAVFGFGGSSSGSGSATSTNNTASGSAPFQFRSSAPQTGGFNFSAAPSTPLIGFSKDGASSSSFSAPAAPGTNAFSPPANGGMFSIGIGSTAPRSRPCRRRNR